MHSLWYVLTVQNSTFYLFVFATVAGSQHIEIQSNLNILPFFVEISS